MDFAPHTERDVETMLATIGAASVDDLFAVIPPSLRLGGLPIPDGHAEAEVLREMAALAAQNRSADDLVCFMGAGAYDHHVPSMVWAVLSRGELATSYTPYQPELSQGVLQTLFEYQTMICELTGLVISNAGLYDGGSALAEAVNLATSATKRNEILLAGPINPNYERVLVTQSRGLGVVPIITGWDKDGRAKTDLLGFSPNTDAAAIVVQQPNLFGYVEDIPKLAEIAHRDGVKLIVHFDLTSAGVIEAPGLQGADIVVAEGQPFGNHLNFGGPYAGVMACRAADVRRLPGRLVGETVDRNGKRAFVLTLQAREQHIRREKATSNICTNQTLNTLAVAVALSWYGPQGLRELGEQCLARAHYAHDRLCEIPGVTPVFNGPFFKEFTVRLPADPIRVCERVAADGYLAGVPMSQFGRFKDLDDVLLIAVTEKRSREEIDGLVDAIARACKEVA